MRHPANTLLLIIGLVVAMLGVVAVQWVVPQFLDVLKNFGAELPLLTRLFVDGGGFLWLVPLLVPVVSACVPLRTPEDKRRGIVALLLGVAIGVVLPLLCMFAMYLPIFKLAAAAG